MGRGRGKVKKTVSNHEDALSGEEENIPIQKRRGRPQKLMKDEIDEEEVEKVVEEEGDTETKSTVVTENGNVKKRKKTSNLKEKQDSLKEEDNSIVTGASTDNLTKSNGFRHIGSRRKSTPRRAAEAGVECN